MEEKKGDFVLLVGNWDVILGKSSHFVHLPQIRCDAVFEVSRCSTWE